MKKTNHLKSRRVLNLALFFIVLTLSLPAFCFAAVDPVATINNAKTLLVSIVSSIGMIVAIYGIYQLGMAWQREDASGRSHGINGLIAGIIIAGTPWLLNYLLS